MEFNPNNNVVKLCLQGMGMEEKGKPEEASKLFIQAWNEATSDFEKFISSHYVARYQKNVADKLKWLETALQFALKINNDSVKSAFPSLYSNIAKCYEDLSDPDKAKKNYELATSFQDKPSDKGPFYHGTKADLQIGDLLTAGGSSNYKPELKMNHIYFTAFVNGAGLSCCISKRR
jgi:tetratricopeptide (TPR) repeat protein